MSCKHCKIFGYLDTMIIKTYYDIVTYYMMKESFNSDGQHLHQYQQNKQSPLNPLNSKNKV